MSHKLFALLISVVLLATACGGSATTSVSPPTEAAATPSSPPAASPTFGGMPKGQRLRFEHVSLEQGISQSTVFCMLQDSQGFIWFGTEDGLNKYDGDTFTIYQNDPDDPNSLGSNRIQAILQDDSGALWIQQFPFWLRA